MSIINPTVWDILGLSVLAAGVTTVGSLIAVFIKEFWAANWFEDRKARRGIEDAYRRYQLPIFQSAQELAGRLAGMSNENNKRQIYKIDLSMIRESASRSENAEVGSHYIRYRFLSNTYRLCAFLGWIEAYRRDAGNLNTDALGVSGQLSTCLKGIQSALADGFLNQNSNRPGWRDSLLFREELRAVGRAMVVGKDLGVMDYGAFVQVLESDPQGTGKARWLAQASSFFENLRSVPADFRILRMRMLVVRLNDLMEVLYPGRMPREHLEASQQLIKRIDELAGGTKWRVSRFINFSNPPHAAAANASGVRAVGFQ